MKVPYLPFALRFFPFSPGCPAGSAPVQLEFGPMIRKLQHESSAAEAKEHATEHEHAKNHEDAKERPRSH